MRFQSILYSVNINKQNYLHAKINSIHISDRYINNYRLE